VSEDFKPLLASLADGATLNEETAQAFFAACLRGEPTPAQIAAAVTAMRMRGEALSEIVAWGTADDPTRRAILERSRERLARRTERQGSTR